MKSFSTPSGSVGTSTRLALRVSYNDIGAAAQLPTELFTKLTASYQQRLLFGGSGVLEGETVFYTELRPRFEMEAPRGYVGIVDHRAWKSVVIIEDIVASKGAEFIVPTRLLTLTQVQDQVENLARMHGAMWEHPSLRSLAKTPFDHYPYITAFLDIKKRCAVGMQRAKKVIAPAIYGQQDRLYALAPDRGHGAAE